ncbi:hybrid nucleoside-diphosphate sugar epimerase/sugar transferase [Psychrobacter sp. ANT_H59]|uniref:hybrid nucleoside-diphosphate sugar epimerase/sugar transferase n=1 Tax=Psychrobacter sp. ANT_H59 TaxID=2597354 RepID=UPI0011ED5968|nr:hybrid nucleoside-diphosphate sugar epimerase/sugar transferase [Psychrobacter sp. ANT_H59]KAA0933461.1 NAD-dependent epimerase/dehydratase family protein [Psychrobacter sp. ANT_H59]
MNILVTGANGFVGHSLVNSLMDTKHSVIAGVRKTPLKKLNCEYRIINNLEDKPLSTDIFKDIDVVIHTAARVHVMDDKSADPLTEFRKLNVEGTLNLARQAVEVGVKRFIFISSIKVNGEGTELGKPYTEDSKPNPTDPYGISKYEAEQGLLKLAETTPLEVVIIRPTLVYGENVKGNFQSLIKWTYKGIPLPIGGIKHNLRSLVSVDNLTDFIITCIEHKDAKNQVFLISDDDDISTADLLDGIAKGLGLTNRALPIPASMINKAAAVVGKSGVAQRLSGSLQVDISKAKTLLGWKPKYSTSESIRKTAEFYKLNLTALQSMPLQRPLDIIFSATGLIAASPLLIGVTVIGYLDTGSPLFIQERVGKDQKPFKLVKFRTMKVDTASVASHLADNSSITKLGKVLRKTKLDELPQLINVLKGEMSLVGPRPNLFNQNDLIEAREDMGVYNVLPGITGLAQLSGIDMSTPERLAKKDKEMIDNMSLKNYFSYIVGTALGKGSGDAVK